MSTHPLSARLAGLASFPGSKRKLAPIIFGLLGQACPPSAWRSCTFVDAFAGSCAISLAAKTLGFGKVLSNDIADRSALIGRALVENSRMTLSRGSVLHLFDSPPPVSIPRPKLLARLQPEARDFMDRAWSHYHGSSFLEQERDLVGVLLLRWVARYYPMGAVAASDAPKAAAREFDGLSAARLSHYVRRSRSLITPAMLLRMAEEMNAAIVPGVATTSQDDAATFLRKSSCEVAYLDPPYPGTQSYERAFALIDEFFDFAPLATSAFSTRNPPLDELFDASAHIRTIVLSMGNAVMTLDDLVRLVGRHRTVERALSIPYHHLGAVATAEKNAANREFLILALKRS